MALSAVVAGGCAVARSPITFKPRSQAPSPRAEVVPGVPVGDFGVQDCGAGSLAAVLGYYGEQVSADRLEAVLPRAENGGVLSVDLLLEARRRGYAARLIEGDAQRVREEVEAGHPLILMLQMIDLPGRRRDYFHYVVVDGWDRDRGLVRVHFGDGRARWTTQGRLQRAWEGAGHAMLVVAPRGTEEELPVGGSILEAVALEEAGRPSEAADAYRRELREGEATPVLWTDLGNAEASAGRREAGERAYRRALELDPDYPEALANLAWLLLGGGERLEEAEALARRALAAEPRDAYLVRDTLARILLARHRCSEAGDQLERALEEAPAGSPYVAWLQLGLGRSRLDCGDPAAARQLFAAAAAGEGEVRDAAEAALAALPPD